MSKKIMSRKVLAGILAATSVFTMGIATAAAEKDPNEGFSVEANYFRPNLTFAIQTSDTSINGGAVDFKKDLGLKDSSFMDYRVHFGNGFRVSYMKLGYTGNGTLDATMTFGDQNFTSGVNINSKLDMQYARVTFIKPVTEFFGITTKLLLDLKGFDINTQVTGNVLGTSTTSTEKVRFAIPTVGFAVDTKLGENVKLFSEVTGLGLSKTQYFYDGEVGLKYEAPNNVSVAAGYRSFDLNIKQDSDHVQFKMAGPFYNVEYKF